jgi:sugar transferase (PEP-CTERM system associated)
MAGIPNPYRQLAAKLLAADVICIIVFFNLAYAMRMREYLGVDPEIIAPGAILLFALYVLDCYSVKGQVSGLRAAPRSLVAVALATLLTGAYVYSAGLWGSSAVVGRGVFPVAFAFFAVWAASSRFLLGLPTRGSAEIMRWLVLGAGEQAARLREDFAASKARGELRYLKDLEDSAYVEEGLVGTIDLLDEVGKQGWTGIIVALNPPISQSVIQALMRLRFSGTPVYDLADFYERYWFKVPVLHTQRGWMVFSQGFELLHNTVGLRLKRLLDLLFSITLSVVVFPILILMACLIRMESGGPAIFRQARTGLDGRPFEMLKFRSMYVDAEKDGPQWAAAGDTRITGVGRVMRALRLDELPQLLNVMRGDMSFIGPRPERPVFAQMLEKEIPFYEMRHLVRPGITGWAQVMYAYGASIEDAREKLQYDLYYIKNYSILLDIGILLKTLRVVLLGQGR